MAEVRDSHGTCTAAPAAPKMKAAIHFAASSRTFRNVVIGIFFLLRKPGLICVQLLANLRGSSLPKFKVFPLLSVVLLSQLPVRPHNLTPWSLHLSCCALFLTLCHKLPFLPSHPRCPIWESQHPPQPIPCPAPPSRCPLTLNLQELLEPGLSQPAELTSLSHRVPHRAVPKPATLCPCHHPTVLFPRWPCCTSHHHHPVSLQAVPRPAMLDKPPLSCVPTVSQTGHAVPMSPPRCVVPRARTNPYPAVLSPHGPCRVHLGAVPVSPSPPRCSPASPPGPTSPDHAPSAPPTEATPTSLITITPPLSAHPEPPPQLSLPFPLPLPRTHAGGSCGPSPAAAGSRTRRALGAADPPRCPRPPRRRCSAAAAARARRPPRRRPAAAASSRRPRHRHSCAAAPSAARPGPMGRPAPLRPRSAATAAATAPGAPAPHGPGGRDTP